MKYYDKTGFYLKQNKQNTRYEIEDKEEKRLHKLVDSYSSIEDVARIVPDKNGKPIFKIIEVDYAAVYRRQRLYCFSVVNRGQSWYNNLTEQQLFELDEWYQAWLDAPETLIRPETPSWIK